MTKLLPRARLGQTGSATVEYLVGVMVVVFATWLAVSAFGSAAIDGVKKAGGDLLGL